MVLTTQPVSISIMTVNIQHRGQAGQAFQTNTYLKIYTFFCTVTNYANLIEIKIEMQNFAFKILNKKSIIGSKQKKNACL